MDGSLFADASEQDPPRTAGPPFSLTDIEPLVRTEPVEPVEPVELELPPDPTQPPSDIPRAHAGGFLPTFPALDGLKGVAVVVVLLFDAGADAGPRAATSASRRCSPSPASSPSPVCWPSGATGRASTSAGFWSRRIRRVLGAALAVLAVAGVFGVVAAASDLQRHALAGDGIAVAAVGGQLAVHPRRPAVRPGLRAGVADPPVLGALAASASC